MLGRIVSIESDAPTNVDPLSDVSWNTTVQVVLAPHPGLTPGQRRAIELDYGMVGGRSIVQTRRALLFYVIRRLGLAEDASTRPEVQQIVMINREEVAGHLETERRHAAGERNRGAESEVA